MGKENTADLFTIHLADENEPARDMPSHLEMVDYNPGKRANGSMVGGAYDPYSKGQPNTNDTARIRRPRVDLRKLSEWIKTSQQVKALRHQDPAPGGKPSKKD